MGLHRRAKMKLRKILSMRESVQDNNSIHILNAITAKNKLNPAPKRIRSMEIESNSFSDSKNAQNGDDKQSEEDDDYDQEENETKRAKDRVKQKNNTLPNQSLLNARNYFTHKEAELINLERNNPI